MPKDEFNPSAYQQAIFEAIAAPDGPPTLVIEAVAGSGKTTTLVKACARLEGQPALFCAFNRSIADELGTRLQGTGVTCSTLHSLGKRALSQHNGGARLNKYKNYQLVDTYMRDHHRPLISHTTETRVFYTSEGRLLQESMLKALDFCRLTLTDPRDRDAVFQMCLHYDIDPDERALDAAPLLLDADEQRAREAHEIDFTDMIWLPVKWELALPTYPWVFVDEAQDLNACQLELVLKCRADGGRMAFVGDRHQAIYGFAGADNRSIETIIERTQATTLPLSICYRCPTAVIDRAREVVAHIEPRPDAPAGSVRVIKEGQLYSDAQPGDMIVSRITAPLITACIEFIKRGTPALVEGRDIGKQLTAIVEKVALRENFVWSDFLKFLVAHQRQQAKYLEDKGADETQIVAWHDRCDAVTAVYEGMNPADADDLKAKISSLFDEQNPLIRLATIHRCKGLQAPRVFIIAPDKLPLQVGGWQLIQEWNLRYVAVTRAMRELIIVGDDLTPGPNRTAREADPRSKAEIDSVQQIEAEDAAQLLDQIEQARHLSDPLMPDQAKDQLLRELDEELIEGPRDDTPADPTANAPVLDLNKVGIKKAPEPSGDQTDTHPASDRGARRYRYGMKRPPMMYACPEGWQDGGSHPDYPMGTAIYTRKLTPDELVKWEMFPISAHAYTFQIGDQVVVNEIDTATITRHAPYGRYWVNYAATGAEERVRLTDLQLLPNPSPAPAQTPPPLPSETPAGAPASALDALRMVEAALQTATLPADAPGNALTIAQASITFIRHILQAQDQETPHA